MVAGRGALGARGACDGAVLLNTILQTSALMDTEPVTIEIPLVQVCYGRLPVM